MYIKLQELQIQGLGVASVRSKGGVPSLFAMLPSLSETDLDTKRFPVSMDWVRGLEEPRILRIFFYPGPVHPWKLRCWTQQMKVLKDDIPFQTGDFQVHFPAVNFPGCILNPSTPPDLDMFQLIGIESRTCGFLHGSLATFPMPRGNPPRNSRPLRETNGFHT